MNRGVRSTCTATLLVALFSPGGAAEEIYKVVGDDGHISYSNEPPAGDADVEIITPPPPPPQWDVDEARQRQREVEQQFEKLDRYRAEQERLRQEARQNRTATVVQNNTIIVGGPVHRRGGFYPGARPARGGLTAPGFRPRPPHAVPLSHGRLMKGGP